MKRDNESMKYELYEREKQDWLYKHPDCTAEEYQQAIREIAKRLGV